MAVTPTIQNVQPVVGGSDDTWGTTNNSRLQEAYVDINALAVQSNANATALAGAVLKTGSTSTGDQVLADVAPTSPLSAGFRGSPVISFDADRTLLASDAGKTLRIFNTVTRTITIPLNTFPVGTVIPIRSFGTAPLSIVRGGGVELIQPLARINADRSIASFGYATLIHEDANIWLINGVGVS